MKERGDKYHILLVARWPVGGLRTFLLYFYSQLDPSFYRLTLLAAEGKETDVLLEDLKNYDIKYIGFKETISNIEFFRLILKCFRNNRFDLVHSNGFTAGLLTSIPARISRTRHIVTCHETFTKPQFEGIKGYLLKCFFFLSLLMIQVIHFVSRDAKDNFIQYIPLARLFRKKMKVIPNGIEVDRFLNSPSRDLRKELNLSDDTFLVGFLGRFMPPKGFGYLVDAIALLKANEDLTKKPLVLTFGEDGFFAREIRNIKKKGIEEYFVFLPFSPNIASILKALDAVVVPSIWEACPIVPMEAMVAGVPVIGSDCVGLREVLKDTPNVVVPSANSAALAEALKREMEKSSRCAAEAFQLQAARRFDVKERAVELEKVFKSLIRS